MVDKQDVNVEFQRTGPDGCTIGVGPVPGRSSLAVTVTRGSVIHTVAYCRNVESAQILADGLRCLLRPWLVEESDDSDRAASRVHDG